MRFIHLDEGNHPGQGDQPLGILVPTEHVTCQLVDVPPVSRKKWQSMIPWLLEERLLSAAESLMVACGDKIDNRVPVVAANRDVVEQWQQRLKEQNIKYSCLVPDFFALPWQSGAISLAISSERWLLRYGRWQGAAGPEKLMAPLLANLIRDGGLAVTVYGQATVQELPAFLQGAELKPSSIDGLSGKAGVDWLSFGQGESARQRQPWPLPAKVAAGLAALSLTLLAFMNWQETRHMNIQADYFESQLRAGYSQYFGEQYDFPMADFQRVVSSRLDNGSGSGPASNAVTALATALASCPQCRIDKLSYSDHGLQALVSGEQAAQQLASIAGVAVAPQGDQWLVSLRGGEQ